MMRLRMLRRLFIRKWYCSRTVLLLMPSIAITMASSPGRSLMQQSHNGSRSSQRASTQRRQKHMPHRLWPLARRLCIMSAVLLPWICQGLRRTMQMSHWWFRPHVMFNFRHTWHCQPCLRRQMYCVYPPSMVHMQCQHLVRHVQQLQHP